MITSQSNIFFSLILSYGIDECISKVSLQSQFKNYCIWLQFKIFKKLILSHNLQGNMSTFSYTCFAGKEQLLCNFLEKLLGELKKKRKKKKVVTNARAACLCFQCCPTSDIPDESWMLSHCPEPRWFQLLHWCN